MAISTTRLTDKEVKAAKPSDKEYNLFDGEGLRLRIKPNGSKHWIFNYYKPTNRKRANLSLGKYPDLSLANARKLSFEARELIAQNIDPQDARKQKKLEADAVHQHTFYNVSKDWFDIKKESVSLDHAVDTWRSLEIHIFPSLSNMPVKDITAPLVIELLRPIEAKGSLETVKRLSQRLNEVMNFATNCGLIKANPLTGIKAAFKKPKKQNMATLAPAELPELMRALSYASIKLTTRCLIEWQLHTMTRPSEAAGAKWEEINLDNKVWTIPAERMKKRREHRIPLSAQIIELLELMKPISGHREFIFPSDREPTKPCNSQTANMALKRMGFSGRLVSHGLRSLASTTLNEQAFDKDLVESALSHVEENQVRGAYNHSDYLERRRSMMSWWSSHIKETARGESALTRTKALKIVNAE